MLKLAFSRVIAWVKAIRADRSEREHSWVCEITSHVDLSAWPQGSRLIARRTKLRVGHQCPPGGLRRSAR